MSALAENPAVKNVEVGDRPMRTSSLVGRAFINEDAEPGSPNKRIGLRMEDDIGTSIVRDRGNAGAAPASTSAFKAPASITHIPQDDLGRHF